MADYSVFVVETIIRAGIIRSLYKASHFVLVEVNKTDAAVAFVVIDIVGTGLAVGGSFAVHDINSQCNDIDIVPCQ